MFRQHNNNNYASIVNRYQCVYSLYPYRSSSFYLDFLSEPWTKQTFKNLLLNHKRNVNDGVYLCGRHWSQFARRNKWIIYFRWVFYCFTLNNKYAQIANIIEMQILEYISIYNEYNCFHIEYVCIDRENEFIDMQLKWSLHIFSEVKSHTDTNIYTLTHGYSSSTPSHCTHLESDCIWFGVRYYLYLYIRIACE